MKLLKVFCISYFFLMLIAIAASWLVNSETSWLVRPEMVFSPPQRAAWLGTDSLGRDLFLRIIIGTRVTILIGLAGTLGAFLLGATVGFAAGWSGGGRRLFAHALRGCFSGPAAVYSRGQRGRALA